MAKKSPKSKVGKKPDFEQSLSELEKIVHQLEEGDIGLTESLAFYERGVKLLRCCHELLAKAERRIELLSGVDADGNPVSTPLDDAAASLDEKTQGQSRRRSTTPSKQSQSQTKQSQTPSKQSQTNHFDSDDPSNEMDQSGKLFF